MAVNRYGYDAELQVTRELMEMGDWTADIKHMHDKFGVHEWMEQNKENHELMRKFLMFRIKFLEEELDETRKAFERGDAPEVLDGLIDLCVVAIGTLDAFGADSHGAWGEVLRANLSKKVGKKASRPNPLGLPDLIKPKGWTGPDHEGKIGDLWRACDDVPF